MFYTLFWLHRVEAHTYVNRLLYWRFCLKLRKHFGFNAHEKAAKKRIKVNKNITLML